MPSIELPSPGLGTYLRITDPDDHPAVIADAIEMGYRHIDTAQKYGNEDIIGRGIELSSLPRDELFIATKIEETNLGYEDVLRTTERSLDRLGLEAVDLLYIHWPAGSSRADRYQPEETLPAFNELVDDGQVRHVGVANFTSELIEEAREYLDVPILALQVEMHPLLHQQELHRYALDNDMFLVAYCPMIRGRIGEVPEVVSIAEKYDATPGQVSLAWLMSKQDVVPIPASNGAHLEENLHALAVELDSADLSRIDAIEREERVVDSEKGPWNW